jgi:hypothetical protein
VFRIFLIPEYRKIKQVRATKPGRFCARRQVFSKKPQRSEYFKGTIALRNIFSFLRFTRYNNTAPYIMIDDTIKAVLASQDAENYDDDNLNDDDDANDDDADDASDDFGDDVDSGDDEGDGEF